MSNLPTQPMSTPPAAPGAKRWTPLFTTVVVIGGLLLLTVIALVFLLIGRGMATTSASESPSLAPTPTASESPSVSETVDAEQPADEPVDTSTRFTSFTAPTTVVCDPDAESKPKIQVSWTSANAVDAYFAPHDGDASDGTGYQVPVSGNQDDIVDNDHEFPCQHRGEQEYTLTLVGPGGEKVHEHWTVIDPDF